MLYIHGILTREPVVKEKRFSHQHPIIGYSRIGLGTSAKKSNKEITLLN
jgi:hypothetical protein